MKKNMIRIACFIFSLGFLLGYINKIFEFKYSDGICQMSTLYELDKNTLERISYHTIARTLHEQMRIKRQLQEKVRKASHLYRIYCRLIKGSV